MIRTAIHILKRGQKIGDGTIEFASVDEALAFEESFNESMSGLRVHVFQLDESTHMFGDEDDMCPNCITPWKCNGPHIIDGQPVDVS